MVLVGQFRQKECAFRKSFELLEPPRKGNLKIRGKIRLEKNSVSVLILHCFGEKSVLVGFTPLLYTQQNVLFLIGQWRMHK